MCKYKILVRRNNGLVRWCDDCKAYNVIFNNVVMTYKPKGLESFKKNLAECYEAHCKTDHNRACRNIYFNTLVDGVQFLFSTNEIGNFLSLLQEASLQHLLVADLNEINLT